MQHWLIQRIDTYGASDGVTGSDGGGGRLMRVGLGRSPDMTRTVKLEDGLLVV